jgi:hypothetical protein
MVIGSKNIAPPKVILPHLHIELGVMKQCVKALNKDGDCFIYVCQKFTALTEAKLKEGIFPCSSIRKLLSDATFENTMNATEKAA